MQGAMYMVYGQIETRKMFLGLMNNEMDLFHQL